MVRSKFIKFCFVLSFSFLSKSYATHNGLEETPSATPHKISQTGAVSAGADSLEENQNNSSFIIPIDSSESPKIQKMAKNLNGCLKVYDIVTGFLLELLSRPAGTISLVAGSGAAVTSAIAYASGYDANLINLVFTTVGVTATAISHGAHTEAIKRVNQNK